MVTVRARSVSSSGPRARQTESQPSSHSFISSARAAAGRAELAVPLAIRLLAVGGQEIRPSRPHVARHMFDDERDGIHLAVQRDGEFRIVDLRHGVFGQFLVIAEERKRILQVRSGELKCHSHIIHASDGREHSTAPCYNENFHHMLDESIQELASRSLARIVAARSAEKARWPISARAWASSRPKSANASGRCSTPPSSKSKRHSTPASRSSTRPRYAR